MVVEALGSPANALSIPDALPVLPLRGGIVVLPLAVMPLLVGQPRSVQLIDDVMRQERLLVLVAQKTEHDQPGPDDLYRVGTAAIVHQLARLPDGTLRVVVQGLERVRLLDFVATDPYLVARTELFPDRSTPGVELEALRRAAVDLFRRLVALVDELPAETANAAEALADARQVAYLIASVIPIAPATRQELLELDPLEAKLRRMIDLLQNEVSVRELGQKITSETQQRMSKTQRDFFLREQLRSIQHELGEGDDNPEIAQLRARLAEAKLPPEALGEAERELDRLAAIPPVSPEYGLIRTYLDWMVSLPWNVVTGGEIDIHHAREVLDADHYDLDKVKDRILEHLAVEKLRRERSARRDDVANDSADTATPSEREHRRPDTSDGTSSSRDSGAEISRTEADLSVTEVGREPILCFVGPPGVGKTSLGQSIAKALKRKFIRMSLGGVRDEAEIRGHRRTYIGALPGRIIQGIRRAEARDPVFMLDEIDKVGSDWRGDPSAALLEVLDPAQNNNFVDNYLGVPFDLSQVLFVATANTLDTIPPALLDRMEIINLAGYTDEEKLRIAMRYLAPKQLTANGLSPSELRFDEAAIRRIIRGYTREAGVRSLERQIASVCRKVARQIAEGRTEPVQVTPDRVEEFLGRPYFHDEVAERTERPGVAVGLAWTPAGGDVLFVEATMMPSSDERLLLTGMLGDVMRESAQAALSYVRSNAPRLGIDPRAFQGQLVHLHVPAGAIPKDGPSAGVTMVTALASLASGRCVRSHLAMTGEITLRGKVLPVGGIKEKVLAAHRVGIKTVVLPRDNERDLEDVPIELRQELELVLVESAEEVLAKALEPQPAAASSAGLSVLSER
jgi:ATP-dependent Lon protease